MESKALAKSLSGEILEPSIDLAEDYAQLALDEVLECPALKEIPIIKTIVALFKTGAAIRERHFAKKVMTFLREFHSEANRTGNAEEFRKKLSSDDGFRERVVEHLLVIIDRYVTTDKAKILGHMFRAHVNGAFNWDVFVSASMALDTLQPYGYKVLKDLSELPTAFTANHMDQSGEALLYAAGIGARYGSSFKVTPLGIALYSHGIHPYFESNKRAGRKG